LGKPGTTRRLGRTLLGLGTLAVLLLAGGHGPASAQALLRWSRADAGTQPITLHADAIQTWLDQGWRVFLMRGNVYLEQGLIQGRMQEAVVWVDEEGKKKTGVYHVEWYGEGNVSLEDGAKQVTGAKPAPRALVQLATRGEVKLSAYGGRIVERAAPQDPLYQRARAERAGQAPPAPGPVERADFQEQLPAPSPELPYPEEPPIRQAAAQGPQDLPKFQPPPSPGAPPPAVVPQPVPPAPPPGAPLPQPPVPPPPRPVEGQPPPAPAPPRQITIRPRSSEPIKLKKEPLPGGETAAIITTGVIVTITNPGTRGLIDIEADRLVVWTRGDVEDLFDDARPRQAPAGRALEFYLAGNVEIRNQDEKETRLLRAAEVYYDVNRNVAIALDADLEVKQPGLPDPVHLQGPELYQLNARLFEVRQSSVNASKLPYDPGLRLTVSKGTLEEIDIVKRGLFGRQILNEATGQPETEKQRLFRASNVVVWLEDVPIFYLPYVQGDAEDPLGPLENLAFNYNRVFGFQAYLTLDVYDLVGLDPVPGTKWRLNVDYLSERGPALGTDFAFLGRGLFGIPNRYEGLIKAYGLHDSGTDILGGGRGERILIDNDPITFLPVTHPEWRGRFLGRMDLRELPSGFSVQTQVSAISDENFLEQFYNREFNNDLNQDTFLYVKQQLDNWAWTVLAEPRLLNWFTKTEWLPRADGWLIGQKFFDLFTYTAHADAAYARLRVTEEPPPPVSVTDRNVDTGRLDLWQELSLPFSLGPVRLVPYGVLDLTHYTNDLYDDDASRAYGAGGLRGSMPLSRLYPEIQSELLNLNGIYHKIVFRGNYYVAHSNVALQTLPQLDRLNDDTTDQALRDINPWQPLINPRFGRFLATSPLYDPQLYALRRLVDNRVDTLDTIQVLQLGVRQRWQTKRGYPGQQHVIDWMTLDLSASYFPNPSRDNFGQSWAFLEYDWTWHVGDRLTLLSNAWYEPIDNGPRLITIGAEINRPNNTSLYLGYRHIDPIQSRTLTVALSYQFSPKYSITAGSGYDFGNNVQVNQLTLTRIGTDLQISAGISYNSIINTVGFNLEVFPNLLPATRRVPGTGGSLLSSLGSGR
jgi:hypothetical protein